MSSFTWSRFIEYYFVGIRVQGSPKMGGVCNCMWWVVTLKGQGRFFCPQPIPARTHSCSLLFKTSPITNHIKIKGILASTRELAAPSPCLVHTKKRKKNPIWSLAWWPQATAVQLPPFWLTAPKQHSKPRLSPALNPPETRIQPHTLQKTLMIFLG